MTKEISLANGNTTIIDDDMFDYLNQWKWYNHSGYARRDIIIDGRKKSIHMHRVIANTPEGMETDHINNNGLDNRRINLRICTHAQNRMNNKIQSNNKSGFAGVSWYKRDKTWAANIELNGKAYYLGRYNNIEDAINAYKEKAIELFGEFAPLDKERMK